jgi:AcrR family transcriptional regulator
MPQTARRSNNRIEPLLEAAADCFAIQGYHGTTMREIAKAVDMLPGSVYYHFPSKEDLLLAVYREGVRNLCDRVEQSLGGVTGPWARLEAALISHLETILDQSAYARVLIRILPDQLPARAAELTALRADYEKRFAGLIADLPLPATAKPSLVRLFLLGAANWTEIWYRPENGTPAAIACQFVQFLRQPLDETTAGAADDRPV